MKLLILGIDPGTTAAFALTTLEGELIRIFSKKNISIDDLINEIISTLDNHRIVFIGCDKSKPPKAVMKISSRLGVKLLIPDHDLSISEKHKLINEYYGKINLNAHEFDALASALYVIKRINSRLNRAIAKLKHDIDISTYLYELLTTSKSRDQVIQEMQKHVVFQEKKPKRIIKEKNQIAVLQHQIHQLLQENKALRKQLRFEKSKFKEKLNEKLLFLTSKVFTLNQEIEKLKNIINSFVVAFNFLDKKYNIKLALKEDNDFISNSNIQYVIKESSKSSKKSSFNNASNKLNSSNKNPPKIYDKKNKKFIDANIIFKTDDFVLFSEQNIDSLEKIEQLIEQYKAERKRLLKK